MPIWFFWKKEWHMALDVQAISITPIFIYQNIHNIFDFKPNDTLIFNSIQYFALKVKIFVPRRPCIYMYTYFTSWSWSWSRLILFIGISYPYFVSTIHKASQFSNCLNQSTIVLERTRVSLRGMVFSAWATASAGVYTDPICHFGSWRHIIKFNLGWRNNRAMLLTAELLALVLLAQLPVCRVWDGFHSAEPFQVYHQ